MPDFRRVLQRVDARGGATWLTVLRGSEVLLDRRSGCDADALFYTFSVSKPFVALSVHLLAERGLLRLDDPVAESWRTGFLENYLEEHHLCPNGYTIAERVPTLVDHAAAGDSYDIRYEGACR